MRSLLRLALALLVSAGMGCGGVAATGGERSVPGKARAPTPAPPRAVATRISGGSPSQHALLRRILEAMGPTAIRHITIKPPDRWHPFQPGDVMLVIRTLRTDRREENLLWEWQGWIVAGAFRDRSAVAGLPRVIALEERNGRRFGGGLRISNIHHGVQSDATAAQAATFAGHLRRIVDQSGARLVRLHVARPDGLAASVIVQTGRPAWYLHHKMPTVLRQTADRFRYDGLAWAVYDASGRRVFQMANASRFAAGAEGTIPSLIGCNPFGPGDIAAVNSDPPPKCPA
jgi:hypothetical protein